MSCLHSMFSRSIQIPYIDLTTRILFLSPLCSTATYTPLYLPSPPRTAGICVDSIRLFLIKLLCYLMHVPPCSRSVFSRVQRKVCSSWDMEDMQCQPEETSKLCFQVASYLRPAGHKALHCSAHLPSLSIVRLYFCGYLMAVNQCPYFITCVSYLNTIVLS